MIGAMTLIDRCHGVSNHMPGHFLAKILVVPNYLYQALTQLVP